MSSRFLPLRRRKNLHVQVLIGLGADDYAQAPGREWAVHSRPISEPPPWRLLRPFVTAVRL